MSYSAYSFPRRRRRRWLLFAPFAVLVAAAAIWTGFWFYASARAPAEIAAWRMREAAAGRIQDCASQTIGGYPFRIEFRCSGASFELKGSPTLRLALPAIATALQVYDPTLLIAEFTGPLDISEPNAQPTAVVSWSLAQASMRGLPSAVGRASLVLDAAAVRNPGAAENESLLTAQRLELHGRPASGVPADAPPVELHLRLIGARAERLHPLAAKPLDAEVAAVLHGLNDIAPKPWPVRFKEWQARDGRIEISKARIVQEDVIAVGSGMLRIGARGGLDGNLQVTVVGIDKVLKMFDIERVMSEGQIGATLGALDRVLPGLGGIARQSAGPGLVAALGKRTVLEDKPAVVFPIRFVDGAVFLGPFRVAKLAPLF
jgi:hypothetical protein